MSLSFYDCVMGLGFLTNPIGGLDKGCVSKGLNTVLQQPRVSARNIAILSTLFTTLTTPWITSNTMYYTRFLATTMN
ncbi:hypothetical protein O3M35_007545 [Rhynocoris fuscipes]|uniref:Uncharacterized protein n=1 Tax=Rhynocoris fuscipes TaxID=488301 RepID=A0AAW1DH67_9HEMI